MKSNPRFLIIRGGAIGDFILTLPALGALRARWPQARMEILGYPHIAELARGRYYADAVRSISYGPMSQFFVPNSSLDPDLMSYFSGFDAVISYFFDPDEIFAKNLRRCGVKTLLTGSARPHDLHAAEHFLLPLEAMGFDIRQPPPRIYPCAEDMAAAAAFLGSCASDVPPPRFVAVHPGSGSDRKNWPLDWWGQLCEWLRDAQGCSILLVLGEADVQGKAALKLFAERLAENLRLPVLAAVLSRCALFIGHDSGITHLAAAAGAPTLALFAATDPAIWRPLGPHVRVLFRDKEWSLDRPATLGAMTDIPLQAVQRVAAEMLKR